MYESLFKRNTIFSISTGDRWISGCHQQDDQHRPHISEIFHAFFQLTPKILLSPGKPRIPVLASDRQRTTNGGKRGQGGWFLLRLVKIPVVVVVVAVVVVVVVVVFFHRPVTGVIEK